MRRTLAIAVATALGAVSSSSVAVMLNPRGTGQVLIYPYYTVNHQQTLVSVINTTEHGKALKVRFREAYDGRDVANFNIYLGPYDSWVGAVFDTSGDGMGAAAIATNDNSCTVPAFPLAPVPGTLHALAFSNANYSQGVYGAPTGTDSGPTSLARTREGFFEIIEMGEVVDQASGSPKTLEAITPANSTPPGCEQVRDAWASGGYWTTNATTDLLPPAGGVYGAAGIVDVAKGTLYAFDATAIDGFSDIVQHTAPDNVNPNLGTAITDSATGVATAYVPIGNSMVKTDYPAATQAIDAVSAVLMVGTLYNEFDVEPSVGAQTDLLVTLPTKAYYVDPAIVGTTPASYLPPFQEVFGGGLKDGVPQDAWFSCDWFEYKIFDRNGVVGSMYWGGVPPLQGGNALCYVAQVVTFSDPSLGPSSVLASMFATGDIELVSLFSTYVYSGHVTVTFIGSNFGDPAQVKLRPSRGGYVFYGLPAIGFLAVNYVNANVTPGVLSNYSAAYPHRSQASCTNSTTPQSACQ